MNKGFAHKKGNLHMSKAVFSGKRVDNLKIAYIGGGSRGWAWGLMSDLAQAPDLSGSVDLYDIDFEAAQHNEIIGNKYNDLEGAVGKWTYTARKTIGEALTDADFVVISILPGTFDEMESDVHWPEKYGIYQPVGDSSGPGGIIRALRTIPMFQEFARAIREYCPNAWVINYTNPMTLCVRTLYKEFPGIKAIGCCHEVFGTQNLLKNILKELRGEEATRDDIKVNVIGVNHFTWITHATYHNTDLFPLYHEYIEKKKNSETTTNYTDDNWVNNAWTSDNSVKFDLFERYGCMAAAGDRHLAEFCEGSWYLDNPKDVVVKWHFGLTPVSWRKEDLKNRLASSAELVAGKKNPTIRVTGEEGVHMMRALLGLADMVTNVNLPNNGQIPNLPMDAVVETNAWFTADTATPVFAGAIPMPIYNLINRICAEQEMVIEGAFERDLEKVFRAFANDPLVRLPLDKARKMFDEMVDNTKAYLGEYFK